ncbi:MAG TPA: DUF4350 domain-containing protein [Anaerolineales bacterium]|nr:DUF4350 domain-containing protein [Anaerolineales bacterium]
MKNLSRDTKLAVGTLLLLVIATALAAVQAQTGPEYPTLSTLSSAPDGALALKLWVKELKYDVDEQVLASFAPSEMISILFMLEPLFPEESELQSIDDWVESGGTLIAIGEQYGMYSVVDHYGFSFDYLEGEAAAPALGTPLFDSPPAFEPKNANVRMALASERDDYVVLLSYQNRPVLVSFEQGRGRVILGTISEAFTNAGLKQAGNPELVLNILALARNKGAVWFDEWHHGLQSGEQVLGPAEFLRATPVGRSLLFVTFAALIVFFLQGRGFGRPVPLPQEIKRRGALEHVTGIANLSRRAAHRPAVMMHYHQKIKRKLGRRYRLDPGIDDKEYVDVLAGYNPSLDKDELLNLLKRLRRKDISETEMVHLAREASHWIDH